MQSKYFGETKAYDVDQVVLVEHSRVVCLDDEHVVGSALLDEGLAAAPEGRSLYWCEGQRFWEVVGVDRANSRLTLEDQDGIRHVQEFSTNYRFYPGKPQGKFAPVEKEGGGE